MIFYFVINMSIAGSALILILLALRLLPIPRRILLAFYLFPALRLCIPFALSSSYSLFSLASSFIRKRIPIPTPMDFDLYAANYIGQAVSLSPMEYTSQRMAFVFRLGGLLWLIVGCALLLGYGSFGLRTIQRYRKGGKTSGTVTIHPKAAVPFVCGIFRPKIILPYGLSPMQQKTALRHEWVHLRRKDNLWRAFALLLAALHWFNPLVWIGLNAFFTDLELSCDELALKNSSLAEKKSYAHQVVSTAAFTVSGGKSLRHRVNHILRIKSLSTAGIAASAAFFLLLCILLLTNPK